MRNSILILMVCCVAAFALACTPAANGGNTAGGNTPAGTKCGGGAAAADVWGIYKKAGATWTLKNTTKIEGQPDMVSYMKTEVTKVDKDFAMTTMTMMDKDKKEMAGVKPIETKIEFKTPEAPKDKAPEAPKAEKKKVKVEAGEFDCVSYDGKNWMMEKYPQVMVKSDMSELIEFKEGK